MKKLMLIAGLIGLLAACGDEEAAKPKEEPKTETKEETPAIKQPKEEAPAIEEKEDVPAVDVPKVTPVPPDVEAINPQAALAILQNAYHGIARVEYKEEYKAFLILPTDPNFIVEMEMILTGKLSKGDWNFLVDSFAMLSGQLGEEYTVFLLNPANTDNYLLMAENGVILYDAFNEDVKKKEAL